MDPCARDRDRWEGRHQTVTQDRDTHSPLSGEGPAGPLSQGDEVGGGSLLGGSGQDLCLAVGEGEGGG